MENPTVKRIAVTPPLKPLCAPLDADQGFAREISERVARHNAAPWERLGLVYLEEYAAVPERPKSDILVNNLTQQIIFRVFLTNRSHRSSEWDQAGFALLKKIFRRIAKARESSAWRGNTVFSYGTERGAVYLKALDTALRSFLNRAEENEGSGVFSEISGERLKRTLTRVLRGISENTQPNSPIAVRIERQRKALLKILSFRSGDPIPKRPVVSETPKKVIAALSELIGGDTARKVYADGLSPLFPERVGGPDSFLRRYNRIGYGLFSENAANRFTTLIKSVREGRTAIPGSDFWSVEGNPGLGRVSPAFRESAENIFSSVLSHENGAGNVTVRNPSENVFPAYHEAAAGTYDEKNGRGNRGAEKEKSVLGTVSRFVNQPNAFVRERESAARRIEVLSVENTRDGSLFRGSLGSRLDSRTLEELNKMIRRAYSPNESGNASPELVHTGETVFRTVENEGRAVMRDPSAETGGDRTSGGYDRQLPPIEYKRNPSREQAEFMPQKRPKIITRRQTQTGAPAITGRLENFSREEINRLADKIYAQIETRVLRERRRVGM